jgi:hypothetical protein
MSNGPKVGKKAASKKAAVKPEELSNKIPEDKIPPVTGLDPVADDAQPDDESEQPQKEESRSLTDIRLDLIEAKITVIGNQTGLQGPRLDKMVQELLDKKPNPQ